MGGVDHVDRFHLGRKFLLSPRVRTPGLLVIVAVQPLVLVFGVYFAGLFEYPAVSVGYDLQVYRGCREFDTSDRVCGPDWTGPDCFY